MKNGKQWRVLRIVLILILTVSLCMLGYRLYQYRQGDKVYEEAEQLVGLPDLPIVEVTPQPTPGATQGPEPTVYVDPYADALKNMDFVALRERNEDVLGWILIPNTRLSYPLLQGEDNDYYINHTWRKGRNSVGSIFMEWRCSPDLTDFNTVIYGHRVNNRSMFGSLLNYKDQNYLDRNPRIYITDDSGTHTYQIFAAYEAELESPAYWIRAEDTQRQQVFIDHALEHSVVTAGFVPEAGGRFLTLSTCTGNGHDTRWVVQAAAVLEGKESGEEPGEGPQGGEGEAAPAPPPAASDKPEESIPVQPIMLEPVPVPETPSAEEEEPELEVTEPSETPKSDVDAADQDGVPEDGKVSPSN